MWSLELEELLWSCDGLRSHHLFSPFNLYMPLDPFIWSLEIEALTWSWWQWHSHQCGLTRCFYCLVHFWTPSTASRCHPQSPWCSDRTCKSFEWSFCWLRRHLCPVFPPCWLCFAPSLRFFSCLMSFSPVHISRSNSSHSNLHQIRSSSSPFLGRSAHLSAPSGNEPGCTLNI